MATMQWFTATWSRCINWITTEEINFGQDVLMQLENIDV